MIKVGSSDIATILGLSPYADASEWQLQAKLLGLIPRYNMADNPGQAMGRMLETPILARYAAETGRHVSPGPSIAEAPTVGPEPWMSAHVDGWVWTGELTPRPPDLEVEVKTDRKLDDRDGWGPHGSATLPSWIDAQVRWQLAVTGLPQADVAALGLGDGRWRIYTLERDLELEKRLVGRVRHWYRRHVLEGVPVDPDGSAATARAIGRAYRGVTGETVDALPSDRELLHQLQSIRSALAELEPRKRELENRLRVRMGTATALRDGDKTLAKYSERRGSVRVDLEELRRRAPALCTELETRGAASRALTINTKRKDTP